jgi:hypothetical protein
MRHLLRHKTICSWHSSHLINFVVLAYAATGAGIRNLARFRKIRFKLLYEVVAPSYNDFHLSPAVVKTVDAFCERFAKSKKYAHGVGEARAVIIFDYGCPNNVPQVLWNDSGRHRALFQRGAVPAELQDLFQKKSPAETAIERLGKSGEAKDVALAQRLRSLPYSEQSIHAFLNVIDRRARRNVNMLQSLSSYSGLPIASCKHLLSECKKWGLVTDENKLSEAGRHERNRLKLVAVFDGLQYPYYPKALRGQRPI